MGQAADAIHGDLRQSRREKVITGFRQRKFRVLVATDIAARGLDIPHIESVINYDLPQCPEDYIHRIGRTARAGASGTAVNLLTPKDASRWKEIHKLLNPTAGEKVLLAGENAPIDATPLNHKPKNPFKPYAPDKKVKNRIKFNKNARDFGCGKKLQKQNDNHKGFRSRKTA